MGMTPNRTVVTGGTGTKTILAGNNARKGATIQNTSSAALFLLLDGGVTANSTTAHSVQVAANERYDLPAYQSNGNTETYLGQILGAWAATAGQALVTEWT